MQLYMAPMEGLTGYVYRNAYQKNYGNIDKYFTPFINNKKLNYKEINDILPEHNEGMTVVPQILTNRAEDFCCIAKELEAYGYGEVNLNLGCPSGTVVAKHRGAGFLALPEELDLFLAEIFEKCPLEISIKTRIGKESPEEWDCLLAIYEKYPLKELIVHPRVQKDFYKNTVNLDAFTKAVGVSRHLICYNGDIRSLDDYSRITQRFPVVERVMLGRGIMAAPWLPVKIKAAAEKMEMSAACVPQPKGGMEREARKKETLRAFCEDVMQGYLAVMSGERNTLFRMKELWSYLGTSFTEPEKYMKKIRKAQRVSEYEAVVDALFREQELKI